MTISSLAIFSRRENCKDELLYVKQFQFNSDGGDDGDDNGDDEYSDDFDADLFQSILAEEEEEEEEGGEEGEDGNDQTARKGGESSSLSSCKDESEGGSEDYNFNNFNCSIRHQFLLQSALERMNQEIKFENQLRTTYRQFVGNGYMWIGSICLMDEYRFYGYITNTNVKMIVAVEDDLLPEQEELQKMRDMEIRKVFVSFYFNTNSVLLYFSQNKSI